MCLRCRWYGGPELCVDPLRTKLRNDGLSIRPDQRDDLLEICNEIEKKIPKFVDFWLPYPELDDSKEFLLYKKYKEIETFVLQNDELKFGIKSTTWNKVFRTHGRSIPEPIRNCLYEMCKEVEEVHYTRRFRLVYFYPSEAIIRRYKTLGHDVLEMEIVDWEDIRKLLKQILVDKKREFGHQGTTVEELDGKQHIIYHRLSFGNDLDYLVNQVVEETGISKEEFVLVYGESLIVPGNTHVRIPDGAKVKLLPFKKELANQSIIVEDLDGQQHIINTNWVTYTNDVDYLVRQVAHTTGISKTRFVLVYKEKLIVPGKHFYIPNGAKIQLLPVKKVTNFPKVFEDTTRLLSDRDFVGISQLLGKGWGMLGIELGLSKVKLQQITEDKQNVASRIFEMLCQWGQRQKGGATAAQLLSAVRKSGVSCEFDKLQRALLIGL